MLRLTDEQAEAAGLVPATGKPKRGNKYGAKRTAHAGRSYDSNMEAARGAELALLEAAGEITGLRHQPRIELERGIFYRPDFAYTERSGREIHEDVKGFAGGERWRLIQKLWALHGPTTLRVTVRRGRGKFVTAKEILPR